MSIEEAETALKKYNQLKDFFKKYNNLKNEYESLDNAEKEIWNSRGTIVIANDSGRVIVNSDLTTDDCFDIVGILKSRIKEEVEKLCKEYNIE